LGAALKLGVLDKLFPEIGSLARRQLTEEDRVAEDAFEHTKRSMDEAASLSVDLPRAKRIAVMVATLCHELGVGESGVEATRSILHRLGLYGIGGYDVRAQVLALVRGHRKPDELYRRRQTTTDGDFRRLAQQVDIDLLVRVATACARASGSATTPEDWFIERARSLGVEHGPPAPLLQGRHLLEEGFEPGPEMGKLLRRVYELQLDGKVATTGEALAAALSIGRTSAS
jgi:tRNA nucleotidyltransferase (CCA-adding enzyme)